MRAISDNHAAMLKAATASAIDAVGGVSKAAGLLRVGSSMLSKALSTASEWRESFLRIDLATQLDRQSPHPFMLTAMGRIVQDHVHAPFGAVTASAVLRLDGVLDDVVREVAAAIEDEHVDAGERQRIRARIVAAKQILAQLDAVMVGVCGG